MSQPPCRFEELSELCELILPEIYLSAISVPASQWRDGIAERELMRFTAGALPAGRQGSDPPTLNKSGGFPKNDMGGLKKIKENN